MTFHRPHPNPLFRKVEEGKPGQVWNKEKGWIDPPALIIGCGQSECFGHGEFYTCGGPSPGGTYICTECELKNVSAERDQWEDRAIKAATRNVELEAQRDELLAALKAARVDVARVESGKFCDLRETLREIDVAIAKCEVQV